MNEHSEKFYVIKEYWDSGRWKLKAMRNAVSRGWITSEEYEEITGLPYNG